MFVTCLFLLLASPVVFLVIKGILVIAMEGPSAKGQAVIPNDSNSENSAIYSPNSTTFSILGDWCISDDVRPWDLDMSDFLNDIDGDAHAATMLGAAGEFALGAEATADDSDEDH